MSETPIDEHQSDTPLQAVPTESPDATRAAPGNQRGHARSSAARPLRRRTPKPVAPPAIPERSPAPERLSIGRIAAAHGVRGEFRMVVITNHPQHLRKIRTVYLAEGDEPWRVSRMQPSLNGKEAIVKLAGLNAPEDAAARRGQVVWIDLADAPVLPEGEYFHYQLIGLDVFDEAETFLGRLAEIIETGANDVYVVRGPAGEVLLPVIEGVILSVDSSGGRMIVRPPEYL